MSQPVVDGDASNFINLLVVGYVRDFGKTNLVQIPHEIVQVIETYFPSRCVVIKNGSGRIKAGFARFRQPKAPDTVFPCVYGQWSGRSDKLKSCVGDRALSQRGILSMRYPVEFGIVYRWDYMEKIWRHVFDEKLCVASEEYGVLLTEKPCNPKANREKATQIMFETFNVPAMYLACDAVLALYATGRLTGCVCDSGDSVSNIVPVSDGHYLPDAVQRLDLAGRNLTDWLMKILTSRGYAFITSAERDIVRDIKEKLCYVALDYDTEMRKCEQTSEFEKDYELPDGQVITIGNERFRATEPMFRPSFIGRSAYGVDDCTNSAIQRCAKEIQSELFGNIVLSGGNMMFPGMAARMKKELASRAPASMTINVIDVENKDCLSWIGGAIFASTSAFYDLCITKEEYDESGPTIVHRKCN